MKCLCFFLINFEGAGVQWSTIFRGASVDDTFSLGNVFIMLIFDSFIYLILTWYIEAVFPGEFGMPQPWYFPITVRNI